MDGVKGAVVILAVQALGLGDYAMFVGALAVVAGHNWPVFLGFRGGKGVATVLGLSMAVLPVWTLVALALSLASGFATRSVVFGIAVGIVAINAFTIATGQDASQVSLCLTLSALVVGTHYVMTYRDVLASVRRKGPWGLFATELPDSRL